MSGEFLLISDNIFSLNMSGWAFARGDCQLHKKPIVSSMRSLRHSGWASGWCM